MVIGHLTHLLLRHAISHDIEIEAHKKIRRNGNIDGGELRRFVGKIHSFHRGKKPSDIDLLGQFAFGLDDAEVVLIDPNEATHFVNDLFFPRSEGLVGLGTEFNDKAGAVADGLIGHSNILESGRDFTHVEHGVHLFGVFHIFVGVVVIVV